MTPTKASLIALFSSLVIMTLGNGLTSILLPVRAEIAAFSAMDIGLMGTLYSIGFVVGCLYASSLIRKIGLVKSFALLSLLSGIVMLGHTTIADPILWIVLRLFSGFASACLFSVIESWLNESSENSNRGMIFGLYMVINLISQTGGRFGIMLDNPNENNLFLLAAITMASAFLPICFIVAPKVKQISSNRFKIKELWKLAPVGVLGNLCFGLCTGAFGSMAPLYAQSNGMGMGGIALFVSAAAIGGAISQYPLGRLSDRIDRRLIIALICLAGSSLSVFFVVADNHIATLFWGKPLFANVSGQAVLCILSLVYGALFYPIYSLSITHTNDHVAKHRYVEASSTNLLIWGIGASIGPFISAWMIGMIGNGGLFLFMSIAMLFIGLNSFYYFYQRHPFTKHVVSKENDLCAEGSPRIPETAAAAPSIQA